MLWNTCIIVCILYDHTTVEYLEVIVLHALLVHTLLSTIMSFAQAVPTVTQTDMDTAANLLSGSDENSPYGRLQIALNAVETKSTDAVLLALANTHPHIAGMVMDNTELLALQYLLTVPSTERYKLRKGDGMIRKVEQMDKLEKKAALILAKDVGIPKKMTAIRVGSYDNISMELEITYLIPGGSDSKKIRLAEPFAPVNAQESRNTIEKKLGTKPLPPSKGTYSLLPLSNGSFDMASGEDFVDWNTKVGFSFEHTEPVGEIGLDKDKKMDGVYSLRFFNTEKTRSFYKVEQQFPLQSMYKIRLQCFVSAKHATVEYRQDSSYSFVSLEYLDDNGAILREDKREFRLGTYNWEQITIDSFIPQDAASLRVVVSSSVSGTIWVDGMSLLELE